MLVAAWAAVAAAVVAGDAAAEMTARIDRFRGGDTCS